MPKNYLLFDRIFLPRINFNSKYKNYDKYRISETIRLKWLRALRLISNQRLETWDLYVANIMDDNRCDKDNIILSIRSKMTHNPHMLKRDKRIAHNFSFNGKIHSNNTNLKEENYLQTFWLYIEIIDRWRCMKREKSMHERANIENIPKKIRERNFLIKRDFFLCKLKVNCLNSFAEILAVK